MNIISNMENYIATYICMHINFVLYIYIYIHIRKIYCIYYNWFIVYLDEYFLFRRVVFARFLCVPRVCD